MMNVIMSQSKQLGCIIGLFIWLNLGFNVDCTCPNKWVLFKGNCYRVTKKMMYVDGPVLCQAHPGGHLVSIGDAEENNFIKTTLLKGGPPNHWIGLRFNEQKNGWQWDDGTPVILDEWKNAQASNPKKKFCVRLDKSGKWEQRRCVKNIPGICEFPLPTTTQPTTTQPTTTQPTTTQPTTTQPTTSQPTTSQPTTTQPTTKPTTTQPTTTQPTTIQPTTTQSTTKPTTTQPTTTQPTTTQPTTTQPTTRPTTTQQTTTQQTTTQPTTTTTTTTTQPTTAQPTTPLTSTPSSTSEVPTSDQFTAKSATDPPQTPPTEAKDTHVRTSSVRSRTVHLVTKPRPPKTPSPQDVWTSEDNTAENVTSEEHLQDDVTSARISSTNNARSLHTVPNFPLTSRFVESTTSGATTTTTPPRSTTTTTTGPTPRAVSFRTNTRWSKTTFRPKYDPEKDMKAPDRLVTKRKIWLPLVIVSCVLVLIAIATIVAYVCTMCRRQGKYMTHENGGPSILAGSEFFFNAGLAGDGQPQKVVGGMVAQSRDVWVSLDDVVSCYDNDTAEPPLDLREARPEGEETMAVQYPEDKEGESTLKYIDDDREDDGGADLYGDTLEFFSSTGSFIMNNNTTTSASTSV